ncbi:MAG: hypothetical protein KGJ55_03800 [Gammaproteobacteria bacterium]|nr:hypothetical protein [Gammaproteobacteria bacterium]
MNMSNTSPADADAWLDALLAADARSEGYIDDAGFTARVMAGLPRRRARSWQWLAPALGALGALGVGLSFGLPGLDQLFVPIVATLKVTADPSALLRAALPLLAISATLAAAGFLTVADTR